MSDDPRPGDVVAYHLAMELIDDFHMTCAEAAQVLTDRGYKCRSHDTARLWAEKGRAEYARITAQDAQARRNRHYLRELARNYHQRQINVVEFVRESMRVEHKVSALHGTDAPKRVEMTGQFVGPMDPHTAAAVDLPAPAPPP
jgi:hypothetical protein